jgi:hypothetical protein
LSSFVPPYCPLARGVILHCLGETSIAADARPILQGLRDGIAAIGPTYRGLETVFDDYLVVHTYGDERVRRDVAEHLRRYWFDPNSPDTFFPGVEVARIYAEGLLKTLDLALTGPNVARIDGWWLVDCKEVKLINLAHLKNDSGHVDGQVTLLILTPRPAVTGSVSQNPILGRSAEAWVTEKGAEAVVTRRLKTAK